MQRENTKENKKANASSSKEKKAAEAASSREIQERGEEEREIGGGGEIADSHISVSASSDAPFVTPRNKEGENPPYDSTGGLINDTDSGVMGSIITYEGTITMKSYRERLRAADLSPS